MEQTINDVEIIQGVQKGDRDSFSKLFYIYYSDLFAFVLRYTGSSEITEDLMQDIFLSIWHHRTTWSPSGKLRPYLYKTARNRTLDYLRSYKVKKEWETEAQYIGLPHSESPADIIHDRESYDEMAEAIEDAIKKLPDSRKMVFLLNREDGLTYQEIAEVLNISVKTVETQMGRSIKTIRQHLLECLPSE
ncbi:MAG: RNA polymerase sigma-70 factor [Balneolales bacterium]